MNKVDRQKKVDLKRTFEVNAGNINVLEEIVLRGKTLI